MVLGVIDASMTRSTAMSLMDCWIRGNFYDSLLTIVAKQLKLVYLPTYPFYVLYFKFNNAINFRRPIVPHTELRALDSGVTPSNRITSMTLLSFTLLLLFSIRPISHHQLPQHLNRPQSKPLVVLISSAPLQLT